MIAERNSATVHWPQGSRPLQNRVDPFGELHAVAERGAADGQSRRPAASRRSDLDRKALDFEALDRLRLRVQGALARGLGQGLHRALFLDEPTALAAGHRPCFECRRAAAKAFLAAFPGRPHGADPMDEALHRERVEGRMKRVWRARLGDLPEGAMIARDGRAYAVRGTALAPWSFAGYGAPLPLEPDTVADVLTPPSTVAALAAGYRPIWAEAPNASP